MSFWCFNCLTKFGYHRIGVVTVAADLDEACYQIKHEHADKHSFVPVNYVPIWVPKVYKTWYDWQCLKDFARMDLAQFPIIRYEERSTVVLNVKKLGTVYNPYFLAPWIWGCQSFSYTDVEQVAAVETPHYPHHGSQPAHYHAGRVRYLAEDDPVAGLPRVLSQPMIEVWARRVGKSPVSVKDGNHRLAAAMYRGLQGLYARAVGPIPEEFILNVL